MSRMDAAKLAASDELGGEPMDSTNSQTTAAAYGPLAPVDVYSAPVVPEQPARVSTPVPASARRARLRRRMLVLLVLSVLACLGAYWWASEAGAFPGAPWSGEVAGGDKRLSASERAFAEVVLDAQGVAGPSVLAAAGMTEAQIASRLRPLFVGVDGICASGRLSDPAFAELFAARWIQFGYEPSGARTAWDAAVRYCGRG